MTTTTAPEITDEELREHAAKIRADERMSPADRWYNLPPYAVDVPAVLDGLARLVAAADSGSPAGRVALAAWEAAIVEAGADVGWASRRGSS